MKRHLGIYAMLLSLLAGCGGGGGAASVAAPGAATPPAPSAGVTTPPAAQVDNSWLTLTPSASDLQVYAGESTPIFVEAVSSKIVSENFNIGIVDKKGVIDPRVTVRTITAYHYQAVLGISTALAAGRYTSNIEVRLCQDDPAVCAKPISGSPWLLPISVTVKPASSITSLSQVAGVPSWSGLRGNALHSGYIAAAFDRTAFSRRWQWQVDAHDIAFDGAVANGQAFIVSRLRPGPWTLYAIDESTGKENWHAALDQSMYTSAPVVAQGKVVLKSSSNSDWALWYFDEKSGKQLRHQTFSGLLSPPSPEQNVPTIVGSSMYLAQGDHTRSLAKYDLDSGSLVWSAQHDDQTYSWTPAVDDAYAYVAREGKSILAYGLGDGKLTYVINREFWGSGPSSQTPILSGTGMAFAYYAGSVWAFDLAARKQAWIASWLDSMPAVSPDTLYAVRGAAYLDAFDAKTGVLRWSVELPETVSYPSVVATKSTVFISSSGAGHEGTYALDLRTRVVDKLHNHGGTLMVSERGVLYMLWLTNNKANIATINLQ